MLAWHFREATVGPLFVSPVHAGSWDHDELEVGRPRALRRSRHGGGAPPVTERDRESQPGVARARPPRPAPRPHTSTPASSPPRSPRPRPGSARPASPAASCGLPDGSPRRAPTRYRIYIVERDLLPMHVKPAYDRHWDLLKLPKNIRRKPNERLSPSYVSRAMWRGFLSPYIAVTVSARPPAETAHQGNQYSHSPWTVRRGSNPRPTD